MHLIQRYHRLIALTIMLAVIAIAALPAFAVQDGELISYSLNEAGCFVDVTATVTDAGFYAINMWDDGNFRAGAGANVAAGGTFTIRFFIGGVILQGAAGIGVYLENIAGPSATTTFDADGSAQLWSDDVGNACAAAGFTFSAAYAPGDCPYPLPPGSRVYNVPAGALAFYQANIDTYAGFNLPPGTWYISEFGDAFAKVWIACEARPVYIPIENVLR